MGGDTERDARLFGDNDDYAVIPCESKTLSRDQMNYIEPLSEDIADIGPRKDKSQDKTERLRVRVFYNKELVLNKDDATNAFNSEPFRAWKENFQQQHDLVATHVIIDSVCFQPDGTTVKYVKIKAGVFTAESYKTFISKSQHQRSSSVSSFDAPASPFLGRDSSKSFDSPQHRPQAQALPITPITPGTPGTPGATKPKCLADVYLKDIPAICFLRGQKISVMVGAGFCVCVGNDYVVVK
eukprot:c12368_g1_i2.p1 GENE.c12368_g1_i2~~c12368_g1_i2.p1  ORF type:complete len:252 (+),score=63.64 c12368_g1_i2:38-757(+)